jgi:aminopeptidase
VFTAPWEHVTEGEALFPWPVHLAEHPVEGIRLRFRAGCVVEATARTGQHTLDEWLRADDGMRVLGEIALGCNYAITDHHGNTLFDEKIGGSFHLALGAAYPPTGGRNRAWRHWDLVCDLRQGGQVEVDGQVISRNGRFVSADWPQPETFIERMNEE